MIILKIKKILYSAILKNYKNIIKLNDIKITLKNNNSFDYDTKIAFYIGSLLKINPFLISKTICKSIKNNYDLFIFNESPGFINIKLMENTILKNIETYNFKNLIITEKNKKIDIEIISANPTGDLHIGHIKNGLLGRTLGEIYKLKGYEINYSYYLNDSGIQIKNLVNSVIWRIFEIQKKNIRIRKINKNLLYKGDEIKLCAKSFIKNKNFDINNIYDINNYNVLRSFCVTFFQERIKNDLKKINIKIDKFYKESYYLTKKNKLLKKLDKYLFKKDNAIWLKTKDCGFDDKNRVLIKSNGENTYLVSDLIYHFERLQTNFDKYLNIWGSDHFGYIERIRSGLFFLFNNNLKSINKLKFLINQIIRLKKNNIELKISKRLGTGITLQWLTKNVFSLDLLKYILLEKNPNQHTLINIDNLQKKEITIPFFYIQYTYVRFLKLSENIKKIQKIKNFESITTPIIHQIIIYISYLDNILKNVIDKNNPAILIKYIYSFCKICNKFYETNNISNENNPEKKYIKLKIVNIIINYLKKLLKIIDIKCLKKL